MSETLQKVTALMVGVIIAFASLALISSTQAGAWGKSWIERSNQPNIAEIAVNNGSFDTLVTALQCTGLDRVVSSKWVRLTVFAPTDDAFSKLNLTSENVCDEFSKRELRNILLYHVTWGVRDSNRVLNSSSFRMLNWQRAPIDASVPSIANAQLNTDQLKIRASNGIIHVVNDVMLP